MEPIKLIQPAPVVRDENGMFQHPDLPDFDEGDGEKYRAWITDQTLQVKMVELEYHSDQAVSDRYFDAGDPDCSYWDPDKPEGDGWFCLSIHDSDDGPVCWWARREAKPKAVPANEEFEAAYKDACLKRSVPRFDPAVFATDHCDCYVIPAVQSAWWAWQASRAALVVTLPPAPAVPEDPEEAIDDSHMDAYHSAVRMRNACVQAIEAAGLKVNS